MDDMHHQKAAAHVLHKFRDHLGRIPADVDPSTVIAETSEEANGHITATVSIAGKVIGSMTYARCNEGLIFVTIDGIPPRDPITGKRPPRVAPPTSTP
jgi:hypothetical protein